MNSVPVKSARTAAAWKATVKRLGKQRADGLAIEGRLLQCGDWFDASHVNDCIIGKFSIIF